MASTCKTAPPARKAMGAIRLDLDREKNGYAIRSWTSRTAMGPGSAWNMASVSREGSSALDLNTCESEPSA